MNTMFLRYGLAIFLVGFLSCGKQASEEGRVESSPPAGDVSPVAEDAMLGGTRARSAQAKLREEAPGTTVKNSAPKQAQLRLEPGFVPAATSASERLLEYTIRLSYQSDNFTDARGRLLEIVGRRGFLGSTSSTLEERARMNAAFAVRAAELTEVLRELEALGNLRSESISVVDHTESYLRQQITAERENIRTNRKAGLGSSGLVAKNWRDRNAALEASENALDAARHEQWKLTDKAKWARVHIELLGPETTPAIVVPHYQRALVGLANLALDLSYVLLWLTPFMLLALLIWLLRRRLQALVRRLRGVTSVS